MKNQNENDIFGYTWGQIQAAQQGASLSRTVAITPCSGKTAASEGDIGMLAKHGLDGLESMQFHGVIDRLKTSGLFA